MREPFLRDPDVSLFCGDACEVLTEMPTESVDCCVTSPPYWGLRDYGNDGQLGLEATPDEYVTRMVEVFREIRRVLADHGTLWLNLGDSYAGNRSYQVPQTIGAKGHDFGRSNAGMTVSRRRDDAPVPRSDVLIEGLKAKDLVGIPWRVAFALQADGWYLRSDIVWSKPNPMPESVTDRPTKSHEYVFLLSKRPRYFFDQEAVRESYGEGWRGRLDGSPASSGRLGGPGGFKAKGPDGRHKTDVVGGDASIQHRDGERWPNLAGRNVRSVWEIATQPYADAHFATFPEELARRCILAGCPVGGTVLDPFMGSGTTALVARKHGRHAIGIDLNPVYLEMAARRLQQLSLLAEGAA